jgi:hypothetical protein
VLDARPAARPSRGAGRDGDSLMLRWLAALLAAARPARLAAFSRLRGADACSRAGPRRLTPDERAVVERNLERWRRHAARGAPAGDGELSPLALAVARGARGARENLQRFRALPPTSAAASWKTSGAGTSCPRRAARSCSRPTIASSAAAERRERIQERFRQFQQLPPEERQRVMENYRALAAPEPGGARAMRERVRRDAARGARAAAHDAAGGTPARAPRAAERATPR